MSFPVLSKCRIVRFTLPNHKYRAALVVDVTGRDTVSLVVFRTGPDDERLPEDVGTGPLMVFRKDVPFASPWGQWVPGTWHWSPKGDVETTRPRDLGPLTAPPPAADAVPA